MISALRMGPDVRDRIGQRFNRFKFLVELHQHKFVEVESTKSQCRRSMIRLAKSSQIGWRMSVFDVLWIVTDTG